MPNLTYSIADFLPFTKIISADVNSRFNDIKTLLNTTGLDDTNLQAAGITRSTKLKAGTANYVVINDGTGKMSEEAQLAYTRGGTGLNPTFTGNAGLALVVNPAETAWSLGSPLQSTITQSFTNDIATLTAGESITANDAVCLDLHNGTGSNVYRVFRCDSDLPARRKNFIGFAVAAATATSGIYTYTLSAALVASNVITTSINSRTYATTYASSSDATLQAVATQIATDPDVASAIVTVVGGNQTGTDDRVITVTSRGALALNLSALVTLGASQATITVLNTQVPVGQNVQIRNFGDLAGFTSLTVGSNYYLSDTTGAITATPIDAAPVFVGQALSTTTLFVNKDIGNYQFTTPQIFVKSHGNSTVTDNTTGTANSEHFNFTSWATGTADSVSRSTGCTGSSGLGGFHYWIDGANTGGTLTITNTKYNKSSWAVDTTRAAGKVSGTCAEYTNQLFFTGGKLSGGGDNTTIESYDGASWTTYGAGTTIGTEVRATFKQNGIIRFIGGVDSGATAYNTHTTFNGSTASTDTVFPVTNSSTGSAQSGTAGASGLAWGIGSSSTASYQWSGSWSSSITLAASCFNLSTNSMFGPSSGFSAGNGYTYSNGGQSSAPNVITTTQRFNGSTWTSDTASATARGSSMGAVF